MRKFTVLIGPDDFDGLECDLDKSRRAEEAEADVERTSDKTQNTDVARLVVKTFLFLIVGALAIAGSLGLVTSNWGPLQSVWLIVAAPLGALLHRYIG